MGGMRSKSYKMLFCFLIGMLAGILSGVAIFVALISYRIDGYHDRIQSLEILLSEKEITLKKLNESINNRKYLLKDIEINFVTGEKEGSDEIDETDLKFIEKSIKGKYRNLIGKEVRNIDMDVVTEIIDRRIFKIDEKLYKLKIDRLLLSEVLGIWVSVDVLE